MLFIESRTTHRSVDAAARLGLLEKLQEKGLIPLIRSARLSCFEQALLSPDRVAEMERAVAAWTETEDDSAYIRGDVFCFEDFVIFLIFGSDEDESAGMRAGIVYAAEMLEPAKKLDAFCRNVSDAIDATRTEDAFDSQEDTITAQGRMAFAQGSDSSASGRKREISHPRAVELLEDVEARRLLRRIRESQAEGRISEFLSNVETEAATVSLINQMADAGLLRREVQVSCRTNGRSLFRLPSPDALNVITASNATCSECGTGIADEKIEDLVKPTEMAAELLEDGSWLANRIYAGLREIGITENQIVRAQTSEEGEAHMMVSVCDEPFLLVMRDGDVTVSQARHALAKQTETEAAHLVVISSGKIQEDARVRLREHARRRARGGSDVEVILIEGVDASEELRLAFDRVSQQALAGELSALDASLGLSVGFIIATRFRLMRHAGALKDLAESAVDALAGSLREF
jgi:hypothetical protein